MYTFLHGSLRKDMNREIVKLIREKRQIVLERWQGYVLSLFPVMMKSATPIAQAIDDGLGEILDSFEMTPEKRTGALSGVIRILAVQSFPPSKSMSVFFALRSILQEIGDSEKRQIKQKHWDEFQTSIEHLTLEAFDSYMVHREKIYQLKVDESLRQSFMTRRGAKA